MKLNLLRRAACAVCLLVLLASQLAVAPLTGAQTPPPKPFELTVDSIMRGFNLVGYQPTGVYWAQDSQRVYFRWKQAGEPRLKEMDLYVVNRDGTGLRRLSEEEARQAPPADGELSKDKTMTVFTEDGDIFIYDHAKHARRQVTRTTDIETNPHFTADQQHIYFTRANNLYVMALDDGSLVQLTDIRTGGEPSPVAPPMRAGGGAGQRQSSSTSEGQQRGTASQEYVKKEERELIAAVREQAEHREELEAKRKAREPRKPFNLPAGQAVVNLALAPDGSYVVATIGEPGAGARNTIVPNFVTESGYTEDIPGRTKVGDAQRRTRFVIINTETGDAKNIDHGQRLEVAPQVRTRTEANATEQAQRERGVVPQTGQQQAQQTEQGQQTGQTQQQGQQPPRTQTEQTQARDRDVELEGLQWSEDGRHAALLGFSADNKDRWVLLLDPATGQTKVLAHQHDDAWIDGPGAFTLGWLPDNEHVYFESEQTGFAQLYTVAINGGAPVPLTAGQFEVSAVRLSPDKTKFYFISSEGSPFERHLYSMPTTGGPRTRITTLPGNNQVDISPDETLIADVRSYSNKPPELYLVPNKPAATTQAAEIKQVTTSPIPEFFTYNWIDPPIVNFKARDGATVYARLYKPEDWRRGGAAVVFVHGAGYLQNVHKWWSSYFREYMFHHLLMARGFIVIDVDYRGSAGYGRDWRTGIYRHMGGKDLTDQVDAVQYLVRAHGVDPRRVGIYGGSYGGFITLMAMFTTPDVFAAGAALRPVTDWAHYNHGYTSDILNLPQSDPEAYKQSSPIYFANGLKGALLICHGMVDTNVNFQDTVRLIEKLIELRKENWSVAPYPVEDHTFDRDASWADEYKRILKLFTANLHPDAGGPASPQRKPRKG